MLGCQSDRTTPPNRVEELFKLYYNIVRTYAQALHERESECQKAPTYSVLKVDLRKSRFKGNFSTT